MKIGIAIDSSLSPPADSKRHICYHQIMRNQRGEVNSPRAKLVEGERPRTTLKQRADHLVSSSAFPTLSWECATEN